MNIKDKETISRLADIIEKNPGCEISIDNDCWYIYPKGHADSEEDHDSLATSHDFQCMTDFYSSGNGYGAAITEAFIELLRRRGLEINASSV